MSHFLHALFYPKTVAVFGASDRAGSLGRKVFARLAASGIPNIVPVNSAHKTVGGQKAFASLGEAVKEQPVDTAVVVLAAEKAAGIVREAARAGISQMVLVNELDPVPTPHAKRESVCLPCLRAGWTACSGSLKTAHPPAPMSDSLRASPTAWQLMRRSGASRSAAS